MKISEIKALYDQSKDIVAIAGEHIEFKAYAPIYDLKMYTEVYCLSDVIQKDDNGFSIIDFFEKKLAFVFVMLVSYTNIEPEIKGDYDFVMESGLWQLIIDHYKDTDILWELQALIDDTLEQKIKAENSIEASVIKVKNKLFEVADKIIEKLPDEKGIKRILAEAKNQINKIKPEQLGRLQEVFEIQKATNGVK